MDSIFAPKNEPAKSLHSALVSEMEFRSMRSVEEWIEKERQTIHDAAITLAAKMGLRSPSREDVLRAETSAMGHVDYAAKFAYGIAEAMRKNA